jgi:hypothetical protein
VSLQFVEKIFRSVIKSTLFVNKGEINAFYQLYLRCIRIITVSGA